MGHIVENYTQTLVWQPDYLMNNMAYSLQEWRILHKYLTQSRVLALLTAAMGVVNVLSAMTPAMTERSVILEIFSPLEVTQGGRLTAVLAGFALLVLSHGLARRHRTAWWLTLAALAVSLVSHLLKGLEYEEASLTLALPYSPLAGVLEFTPLPLATLGLLFVIVLLYFVSAEWVKQWFDRREARLVQ